MTYFFGPPCIAEMVETDKSRPEQIQYSELIRKIFFNLVKMFSVSKHICRSLQFIVEGTEYRESRHWVAHVIHVIYMDYGGRDH